MKRVVTVSTLFVLSAAQAVADTAILFDFEDPAQVDRLTVNTPAEVSGEWASQGQQSLKVTFPKYIAGETPEFPNVACWNDSLPVRDWRPFRYYTFDIWVPEGEIYLGIIVQRSKERRDRLDRRYNLPAGKYRMWFNIENLAADGGDMETVAKITEIEFFQSKPKQANTLFIDNIRLLDAFTGNGSDFKEVWVETLSALAATPPSFEKGGPSLDRAEPLATAGWEKQAEQAGVLDDISEAVTARAASESLAVAVERDFAETGYGVMVAPAGEHVFFTGQGIDASWERSVELDLLRGEIRSAQLVVFPRPGEELQDVSIEASALTSEAGAVLPASTISLELVGYVYLAESAMHRLRGFTDFGWYPDPILALDGPFDVKAPREVQPVLLTVKIPRDAAPGAYRGTVTVAPTGRKPYAADVSFQVHDATMPVAARLPNLLHAGFPELFPDFRLNPNNGDLGGIYRWGSAVAPQLLKEYADQGMNRFNLLRVSQFNIAARCAKDGEDKGIEGFLNYVSGFYPESRMEELVRLGLADKCVFYGFDEVDADNPVWRNRMVGILGGLKSRYGKYGVRTATTAHPWAGPEAWDLPVDIWIPLLRNYDKEAARLARERGVEVWWYSIGWEIHHQPLWARAMMWASYANRVDGWLYYHTCDWVDREQRLENSDPLTAWSPLSENTRGSYGTGAVVYFDREGKPRPSLRLVNLREGMFDYDLLCLLQDRLKAVARDTSGLTYAQQIIVEEARDLLAMPWQGPLHDYVVNREKGLAIPVGDSMSRLHNEALRLLDALNET